MTTSTDPHTPHPVEAVVFDFGGVFTESPLAVVRRAATHRGIDPVELMNIMLGSYGVESDHPWQQVERGELALEDARVWARTETHHRFGVAIDPLEVMAPLLSAPPRREMLRLAGDLRGAGVATALLTNNARELGTRWRALADWDSLFDVIVDSSEIGVRKPERAAYEHTLHELDVSDAASALMIDDFPENVDGARRAGMQAVLCDENPAMAIREVRRHVLGETRWSLDILSNLAFGIIPW